MSRERGKKRRRCQLMNKWWKNRNEIKCLSLINLDESERKQKTGRKWCKAFTAFGFLLRLHEFTQYSHRQFNCDTIVMQFAIQRHCCVLKRSGNQRRRVNQASRFNLSLLSLLSSPPCTLVICFSMMNNFVHGCCRVSWLRLVRNPQIAKFIRFHIFLKRKSDAKVNSNKNITSFKLFSNYFHFILIISIETAKRKKKSIWQTQYEINAFLNRISESQIATAKWKKIVVHLVGEKREANPRSRRSILLNQLIGFSRRNAGNELLILDDGDCVRVAVVDIFARWIQLKLNCVENWARHWTMDI